MPPPLKVEKLGSPDVAWLRMEAPTNPLTVVGLLILAEPLGIRALKALLEERLLAFGRFSQKIEDIRGSPTWVTDRHFDLDAHVHAVSLGDAADKPSLESLVGRLMSAPLDLGRPPWEVHHVEHYGTGSAVVIRLHHTIADGIALVHVLLSLGDEQFAALDPENLPAYGEPPGETSLVARAPGVLLRGVARIAAAMWRRAGELARDPGNAVTWARDGIRFAAAATRIALLPADSPTRFKAVVGMTKRVAWSGPIPLSIVRAVGRTCEAKVNDVLIASVAGGLRRYLLARGEPVQDVELGCVIPVNLRPRRRAYALGNVFGMVFLELPLASGGAADRLRTVQQRMSRLKQSSEPAVAFTILRAIGAGPRLLHRKVVDVLSAKSSAVITNVPGPGRRLHLGGNPISEVMYWVPRTGNVGLGISILSYEGTVRLGVATDAGMAPDPAAIVSCVEDEFEELSRQLLP